MKRAVCFLFKAAVCLLAAVLVVMFFVLLLAVVGGGLVVVCSVGGVGGSDCVTVFGHSCRYWRNAVIAIYLIWRS